MTYPIVQRYAQAIFEAAQESGQLVKVSEDFMMIKELLSVSIDLHHFMDNPIISSQERIAALTSIFESKISGLAFTFLSLLESKRRLCLIDRIIDIFEQKYQLHNKTVKAQITSSMPLSEIQVNDIINHLKKKTGFNVIPVLIVDDKLIGGVIIQINDQVYDYSIETQLKNFYQHCLHAN